MSSGLGGDREGPAGLGSLGGGGSVTTSLGGDPAAPLGSPEETRGPREGLILLLFTVLSVLAVAGVVAREEHAALHDPAEKAARGDVTALDNLSFVRQGRLGEAIAALERRGAGNLVTNLRVEPTRVDAIVRNGDGDRQSLQVGPTLKVTGSSFGAGLDVGVPLAKVDTGAPQRLLASVSRRAHVPASDLNYLVLTVSIGQDAAGAWLLFLKHGRVDRRGWTADAHGRDVRLIGQLPASLRTAQLGLRVRERRRAACLRRARTAAQLGRCPGI